MQTLKMGRKIITATHMPVSYTHLVADYADQNSQNHKEMVDTICKRLKFTSLKYHELEDMIESIGIDPCKVCTYCWNGKE